MEETDKREGNVIGVSLKSGKKSKTAEKKDETSEEKSWFELQKNTVLSNSNLIIFHWRS